MFWNRQIGQSHNRKQSWNRKIKISDQGLVSLKRKRFRRSEKYEGKRKTIIIWRMPKLIILRERNQQLVGPKFIIKDNRNRWQQLLFKIRKLKIESSTSIPLYRIQRI